MKTYGLALKFVNGRPSHHSLSNDVICCAANDMKYVFGQLYLIHIQAILQKHGVYDLKAGQDTPHGGLITCLVQLG